MGTPPGLNDPLKEGWDSMGPLEASQKEKEGSPLGLKAETGGSQDG